MLEQLDSYDWREAFGASGGYVDPAIPDSDVDRTPARINDVTYIAAKSEGENDSLPWRILFCLADGRWVFLSAWCDYTGWDCQAGGSQVIGESLSDVLYYGMSAEDRKELGF